MSEDTQDLEFEGVDPRCSIVYAGTKELRRGFTTGTCAALAAQAACILLLSGTVPNYVSLKTPAGIVVNARVLRPQRTDLWASCCIKKDAGDDIDVTDGLIICAKVEKQITPDGKHTPKSTSHISTPLDVSSLHLTNNARHFAVEITGGEGVGIVTKPGLEQTVGRAAINSVPRRMIEEQIRAVCASYSYSSNIHVEISVPQGAEVGKKTFNPHLGIEGGISILGTSGIVEPRSLEALRSSIEVELRQAVVLGNGRIVMVPGNYGHDFAENYAVLSSIPQVQCANFIGNSLDNAVRFGAYEVLIVGHIGKMVKVAAGVMDTHSHVADCRCEVMCAHAALAGVPRDVARALMSSATTDACLDILDDNALLPQVVASLSRAVQDHLDRRVQGQITVGAIVFSKERGELFRTKGASKLLERWAD